LPIYDFRFPIADFLGIGADGQYFWLFVYFYGEPHFLTG
jgi:hypothetical protein